MLHITVMQFKAKNLNNSFEKWLQSVHFYYVLKNNLLQKRVQKTVVIH